MYDVVPFCGQNHFQKWSHGNLFEINILLQTVMHILNTNLRNGWLKFSILMRITDR